MEGKVIGTVVHLLWIALQAVGIVLLVDIIAGGVHWAEDTFWTEETPILGKLLIAPSIVHHAKGGENALLQKHWARSSRSLLIIAPTLLFGAWLLGILTWQVWLFVIVGACSQQVHRFSHTPTVRTPAFIRLLQRYRIIQAPAEHWRHHRGEHNTHYCVVTPYSNPILDRIGFWRGLERVLVPIFGAPRRDDLRDKPWYQSAGLLQRQLQLR
jgi:ubiquitin-conjugating enzyme E2 variant